MVKKVVDYVTSTVDCPLCLDPANPVVIEAGLSVCKGKPLVNAISGEQKKIDSILPVVHDYKAAVIGLTMDDNGIPMNAEERVAIAEKILNAAVKIGIPIEDVIIDPLVLTVASNSKAAVITLQTIELLQKSLQVNINVGASNVSFGLPDRPAINQVFLTLCLQGYVSVVNFESEQERDEYLETIGEKISSFGGCRSQCQ